MGETEPWPSICKMHLSEILRPSVEIVWKELAVLESTIEVVSPNDWVKLTFSQNWRNTLPSHKLLTSLCSFHSGDTRLCIELLLLSQSTAKIVPQSVYHAHFSQVIMLSRGHSSHSRRLTCCHVAVWSLVSLFIILSTGVYPPIHILSRCQQGSTDKLSRLQS